MSESHKICPLMSMGRMVPVDCAMTNCQWYVKVDSHTEWDSVMPGYEGCAISFLHDIMVRVG